MSLVPLFLLYPLLAMVAISDLRALTIPNRYALWAVVLFVATAPLLTWDDLSMRMTMAAVVFMIGFLGFAGGLIGGGDVKFLSALLLFIPAGTTALFAIVFSGALMLGIAGVLTVRRLSTVGSDWEGLGAAGRFPMGVSIALAGIAHPILVGYLSYHLRF